MKCLDNCLDVMLFLKMFVSFFASISPASHNTSLRLIHCPVFCDCKIVSHNSFTNSTPSTVLVLVPAVMSTDLLHIYCSKSAEGYSIHYLGFSNINFSLSVHYQFFHNLFYCIYFPYHNKLFHNDNKEIIP
jgi:hypothetical protein